MSNGKVLFQELLDINGSGDVASPTTPTPVKIPSWAQKVAIAAGQSGGDFGGATLTIWLRREGSGDWYQCSTTFDNAADVKYVAAPPGTEVSYTISGTSGTTDLKAEVWF